MGLIPLNEDSGPVEFDCGSCGKHHVVDPAVVNRMLRHPLFVCAECRRIRRTRNAAAVGVAGERPRLICDRCVDAWPVVQELP